MNRQQRRATAKQQPAAPVPRPFITSVIPGTGWWWLPVGGMASVKDAWHPFDAAIQLMASHGWIFPCGWAATIMLHWLVVGVEQERQKGAARESRRVRPERK